LEDFTTKGIMNSICSKNDLSEVKKQFLLNGYSRYWSLFLFPSVDWSAKGKRVKNIMERLNASNHDDRVILLNAVKPFLNLSRQKKLNNCIKQ